jgi:hypothetical protein
MTLIEEWEKDPRYEIITGDKHFFCDGTPEGCLILTENFHDFALLNELQSVSSYLEIRAVLIELYECL